MSIETTYDVIVIGGGASGMMSAGRASERGLLVLLIEKNPSLGKKLSITGGGRCNVTNAEFDTRALLKHYGDAEQFLYSSFTQFGPKDVFSFFESRGLALTIEDRKRAFPETHKATDVTRIMERYVRDSGVQVLCDTSVRSLLSEQGKITGVETSKGIFKAKSYIIATGGSSHPETGSTGEGFSWLQSLGHTTHTSNPNLVPLVVKEKWVQKIAGTVLQNVQVTFKGGERKIIKQGNILMTHFGLSGPTILNSAFEVQELLKVGKVTAHIDLFPKEDIGALRTRFQTLAEQYPNKTLYNALREWFSAGVVEAVLVPFAQDVHAQKMHSLSRELRQRVVNSIKSLTLTITGVKGFDWAVVSDGGVDLKEIDTRTMRSRIHENLYIVGDALHVNRPSGGYSLQLCWTTGWVAGNSI